MPFAIEYGPKGNRQVVRGLKLDRIATKAEELEKAGEANVKIFTPSGETTLHQFKLDLHSSQFG
jgi:hypothetical protein